jgi:hypothetical protein
VSKNQSGRGTEEAPFLNQVSPEWSKLFGAQTILLNTFQKRVKRHKMGIKEKS